MLKDQVKSYLGVYRRREQHCPWPGRRPLPRIDEAAAHQRREGYLVTVERTPFVWSFFCPSGGTRHDVMHVNQASLKNTEAHSTQSVVIGPKWSIIPTIYHLALVIA